MPALALAVRKHSEFAAYLVELRQTKSHRPMFNAGMNRAHRPQLIKVSGGPTPKLPTAMRRTVPIAEWTAREPVRQAAEFVTPRPPC